MGFHHNLKCSDYLLISWPYYCMGNEKTTWHRTTSVYMKISLDGKIHESYGKNGISVRMDVHTKCTSDNKKFGISCVRLAKIALWRVIKCTCMKYDWAIVEFYIKWLINSESFLVSVSHANLPSSDGIRCHFTMLHLFLVHNGYIRVEN